MPSLRRMIVAAVFFLGQAEFFVDLHHHRAGRPLVLGQAARDQLIHDGLAGLIHLALEEPDVNVDVERVQDVAQLLQAPLARHAPELADGRVAGVPAAVQLAPLRFVSLALRGLRGGLALLRLEQSRGLGVDLQQPLAALMHAGRLLAAVELVVGPQDRDHAQADIAGVGGPDGRVARELQQPRQGLAQDGVAGVADMKRMVRVGLGVLHHHALGPGSAPAEVSAGLQHRRHHARGICRGVKIRVEVGFLSRHPRKPGRQRDLLRHPAGQLLGPLGHVHFPAGAGLGGGGLEAGVGALPPLAGKGRGLPFDLAGIGRAQFGQGGLDLTGNPGQVLLEHGDS